MIRRNAKEETGRPPWFVGGNLGVQVLGIRLTRFIGRRTRSSANEERTKRTKRRRMQAFLRDPAR